MKLLIVVDKLLTGFDGHPRSTFREPANGFDYEAEEFGGAPADIEALLTSAPVAVDELIRHPELLSLGGEERVLSVLFSDVAGFSTISDPSSPTAAPPTATAARRRPSRSRPMACGGRRER